MLLEGTIQGNTRYVPHIGTSNTNTMNTTSKVGAVDGCVSCKNPNIDRDSSSMGAVAKTGQTGGAYYGFSETGVHAGGPSGGLMHIQRGTNCGISSDLNMNSSTQHSNTKLQNGGGSGYGYQSNGIARYGFDSGADLSDFRGSYAPIKSNPIPTCKQMIGGSMLCNDIQKIKHFKQVHAFWASICPGAVMIYDKYLEKLEKSHKQKVLNIVRGYTKAFCHEVCAFKLKKKESIKRELVSLKNEMNKVEKILNSIAPNAKNMHKMVRDRHIHSVEAHYKLHSKKSQRHTKKHNKKHGKQHKNTSKKQGKMSKTVKRNKNKKNKTRKQRKTMKGGYYQYSSNIPYTANYAVSTDGGYKMNTPGATMNENCVNCKDNYNHYDGSSHQTGVFDKDVHT